MARGNRKAAIFDDAVDRRRFLDIIADAADRYDVRVLADVEMNNHYHLVLDTPRGNLSRAMRHINGVYTQCVNRRHHLTGHVFEGRFTSQLVGDDLYLRTVLKYVVVNPVNAGLATKAEDWPWSSYRATAGLAEPPPFLHLDWLEWVFGGETRAESQARYRAYVNDTDTAADSTDVSLIVVGSPSFETAVRQHLGKSMAHIAVPRVYRSLARPGLDELFTSLDTSRSKRDSMIRRAHVVHGYQLSEIATHLGMHANSMSKILTRLKKARG